MAAGITPPRSGSEPPLTPPSTEEKPSSTRSQVVIDSFRHHQTGQRSSPWTDYRFDTSDYAGLLRMLNADKTLQDYVEDKVRVLQRGDGPAAEFAKEIKHFASSRIELPNEVDDGEIKFTRREPDASFGHCHARYPGVVIEVCYSQKSHQIHRLADDYILSTDGSINTVVCLDVDYNGSKKATISVWRPTYEPKDGVIEFRSTPIVKAQTFRTSDGHPVEEAALRLMLKDFGTEELTRGRPELNQEVTISSEQLCCFLSEAEARQKVYTRRVGSKNKVLPGAKKRRRSETPPDHLSSDESTSKTTGRDSKRGRLESDYSPSSPSATSDN
ncbi:hypothetical protein PITC_069030 [Penicillium italicum]|uniref:Uncharacterized protein n=1 Tax=Penicillium italicum TaxID=40296 RepID=A0A0A2LQA8_PENIT|nr:hypothetical protein PITC_069030 [Penicillium italicum]